MAVDYLSIINKYFGPSHPGREMYLIHVSLVASYALAIAERLSLDQVSLDFIEEAAMLHDIGCCNVYFPEMSCYGALPYLCHMTEGRTILEMEGLPKHAHVAANHTVGIRAEDIRIKRLPLEEADYLPETLEERIIAYADLFYSKSPKHLLRKKTLNHVRKEVQHHGEYNLKIFEKWHKEFNPDLDTESRNHKRPAISLRQPSKSS